jgi:hypothetical protein
MKMFILLTAIYNKIQMTFITEIEKTQPLSSYGSTKDCDSQGNTVHSVKISNQSGSMTLM